LRDDYDLGHLVQGIFERTVKPTQEDYEDANKRLEQVQTPGSYLPRQLPSEAGLGYFKLLSLLTTAHRRSGDHLAAYLRRTRSLLTQLVLEYPPEYTPSPAGTPDLDRQLQLIGPVHDSDQSSEGEEEVSEEVLVLSPASQAVVNSEAITACGLHNMILDYDKGLKEEVDYAFVDWAVLDAAEAGDEAAIIREANNDIYEEGWVAEKAAPGSEHLPHY
ncbi:hypothetical protein B484DRAFT_403161, partial [Ochromonadaceae sp. CCMP2298]